MHRQRCIEFDDYPVPMRDQGNLADDLRTAADVGAADLSAGRFLSFDTPSALGWYLQHLATEILAESSIPSVRIFDKSNHDCKLV